jgi:hypothetical protein
MKYDLSIREHNIQPHIDIEKDLTDKGSGQFTFTIRVNNGNIVDYNVTEVINARDKYLQLKSIVVEELTLSHNVRGGSTPNPLWPNNF